jgi:hypothetical protein
MPLEIEAQLNEAVAHANAAAKLVTLAERLRDNGATKQEVCDAFEAYLLQLRAENRGAEEDAVCDALDFIVGWCRPDKAIFPE